MAFPVVKAVGWARIAVGVALIAVPRLVVKAPTGEEPSGAAVLLARTVGIRDLVIGVGTLSADRSAGGSGPDADVGRWAHAALTSDLLDLVTGLVGGRWVGTRGTVVAAGSALPMVAADIAGLVQLARGATPGDGRAAT